MNKLDHEGVTKVIEACETQSHLMLVMEYVPGGDLLNVVKAQGKVPEKEAKHIFK
jgi:serine/threonine protein kinase